jgi:uncharacterized membrane protein HdeD (DUF308 family)
MNLENSSLSFRLLLIRGVIAIGFGLVALSWPEATARAVVILFAVFFLVDGLTALIFGLAQRSGGRPLGITEGGIGLIIAILALLAPEAMATALVFLLGIWAVLSGLVETGIGFQMARVSPAGYVLAVVGVLSLIFGGALMFFPDTGIVVLTRLLGAYALVFGGILGFLGVTMWRRQGGR